MEEETTVGISTSRQSFTQRAEHFSQLLTLIRTVDNYEPNEDDLKMENLDNLLAEMNNATAAVDQTEAALNKALRLRNEVLYARKHRGVRQGNACQKIRALGLWQYFRPAFPRIGDTFYMISK